MNNQFAQLGRYFEAQEQNWVKGARQLYQPKEYTDSTNLLIAAAKEKSESATEYREPLYELDWHDFNKVLAKLRPLPLEIYKLSRLHYYIDALGRRKYIYRRKWVALGITEYKFEQQLAWSIDSIKRWGDLL
jgi:hypothetical protein